MTVSGRMTVLGRMVSASVLTVSAPVYQTHEWDVNHEMSHEMRHESTVQFVSVRP